MALYVPLWFQRCDGASYTLHSQILSVSGVNSITLFGTVLAVGPGTSVGAVVQDTVEPNNPNSWRTTGSSILISTVTSQSVLVAGDVSGTTEPLGPWIRVRATIVGFTGGITWSAAVVFR